MYRPKLSLGFLKAQNDDTQICTFNLHIFQIGPHKVVQLFPHEASWSKCSIYHLHACTYAGDFDSVLVTFHNVPAHVNVEF